MFVFALVVLFCIALVITLIGLYLSPRSRIPVQRDMVYAPRTGSNTKQGKRVRNVRLNPTTDHSPRRQMKRSSAAKALPTKGWMHAKGIVDLLNSHIPHWLKLTLISGTIFSLCLLLFAQMMIFKTFPAVAIIYNMSSQATAIPTHTAVSNTTLYAENLGISNASKSIVRIAQLDLSQYSSQDEYNTWAYSGCSPASMTEVINAYGHNYRITDILKIESDLHEITPELGLLEAKGIDLTMAQFGFKMIPLEHATLDGAIAVANQGHPVIISFVSSDYRPGGHILVLRGGDSQDVYLADSSRLNLTVVARTQFLQWWRGFIALAVPQ